MYALFALTPKAEVGNKRKLLLQEKDDKIFTRKFLGSLASIAIANFVYSAFRIFFIFAVGAYSLKYLVDHPELIVFVMTVGTWLGVWKCVEISDRWFNKCFPPKR